MNIKELQHAIITKDLDKVLVIVKTNLELALKYRSKMNMNLLHYAVANNFVQLAQLLIDNKFDKTEKDLYNMSAVDIINKGTSDKIRVILNI